MNKSGEASAAWPVIHAERMSRHLLAGSAPPGTDAFIDALAVAGAVGGLQAQVDGTPPLSVLARNRTAPATRVRDDAGWSKLVRMWAMRGTVHLVPEADAHRYAAALGDSIAARETRLWPRQGVAASAEDRLDDAMIAVLAGGPLERRVLAERVGAQLGDQYRVLLEHPWGIGLKPAVARGLLRLHGSGAKLRVSLPDKRAQARIGSVDTSEAQCWLAGTYLTANVVGNAASFAAWSGLPARQAHLAVDSATESIVTVDGRQYASRGSMARRASGRDIALVPAFDPYTLAVADKNGFCAAGTAAQIYRSGGWVSATIVRAGLPIGVWKVTGTRTKRIECEYFDQPNAATARAIAAEVDRVENFLAGSGVSDASLPYQDPGHR